MDIYLVRHTKVATAPGICYGRSDVDVAATYAEDEAAVRARLEPMVLAGSLVAYASPLRRCRQLAEALVPTGLMLDDRLMEYDFGQWELQPWDALPAHEVNPWMADFVHVPAPGGETFQALHHRATAFLTEALATAEPDATIVIVSHSAVIRSLLCHCLGLPLAHAFRLDIDYGSITKVRNRQGQFNVAYTNA
ncbi:alpha-ribazole phosphatase family protein [Hymenobacter taeanensis]|uniref:Alpha-ribazole phosphatase family protein n=1 Tax=Hymenobacter taeanensis TaxID=2735321 RepID=A0A6M6BKA9_9BACT|nr:MULTISPECIES: alpha-ribazole phosphatase family protein [Hymenobacter]QJX48462.1 alpha-ribazole phosphatase family protein [Hymenobacter taeanensis]UOQ82043.1 alpha-ribazole phosphatase family protein [Hymenobacter sp. 5414T-23]